jgi:hypothetical protein
LHSTILPKPWQWWGISLKGQLRGQVYLRFLRRLLNAPDVALKVPKPMLKIWLKKGPASDVAVYGLAIANFFGVRLLVKIYRKLARVYKKRMKRQAAVV